MKEGNVSSAGEFYLLTPDTRGGGRGRGVVMENKREIPLASYLSLPPGNGGLSELKEIPRLRLDSSLGEMPRDLEGGFRGYWLVSEPLRCLLEAIDGAGFEFRRSVVSPEHATGSGSKTL